MKSVDDIATLWQLDARFEPAMSADQREHLLSGWAAAIGQVRSADQD